MDFSEIKELKFIFPQKKFCYFLTKLKAELWLMPGTWFFQYDSYQQGSIAPHALKGQKLVAQGSALGIIAFRSAP